METKRDCQIGTATDWIMLGHYQASMGLWEPSVLKPAASSCPTDPSMYSSAAWAKREFGRI